MPSPSYYWPEGAEQGESLGALKSCFKAIGYEICDDGKPQQGYSKVALYRGEDGRWTHAARQVDGEEWTSKLGNNVDIRHRTPGCLHGPVYGAVALFMRKPEALNPEEKRGKKPGPKEPPPLNIEGDPMEAFDHFLNNRVKREVKPRGKKPKGEPKTAKD